MITSGYTGVRRHGLKWQAKDKSGAVGTFDDPYVAACALAEARGRPKPERTEDGLVAALVGHLRTVPSARRMLILGQALVVLGQETETQAPAGGAAAAEVPAPAAADASAPAAEVPAAPSPARAAAPTGDRHDKRVTAITNWWRAVWTTGSTFQLSIAQPELSDKFEYWEGLRLRGQRPEYEVMTKKVFTKLLKDVVKETSRAVCVDKKRRPSGGGPPAVWWKLDPEDYCPKDLLDQWRLKSRTAPPVKRAEPKPAEVKAEVQEDEDENDLEDEPEDEAKEEADAPRLPRPWDRDEPAWQRRLDLEQDDQGQCSDSDQEEE